MDFKYKEIIGGIELVSYIGPLRDYGTLVIPDKKNGLKVISIGEGAFKGKGITMKRLVLPKHITHIKNNAFIKCGIEEVSFPESLQTIGEGSFSYNRIKELNLPNSVKKLGAACFTENEITEIKIPKNIKQIEEYVFSFNKIKKVNIPDNVIILEEGAFAANEISRLTIGSGIKKISSNCFRSNELVRVSIPSNVEIIEYFAFQYNNELKTFFLEYSENPINLDFSLTNITKMYLYRDIRSFNRKIYKILDDLSKMNFIYTTNPKNLKSNIKNVLNKNIPNCEYLSYEKAIQKYEFESVFP